MNYIKNIAFLFLILISTQGFSQCYELKFDHVGADAFKSELLGPAACELIDSVSGSPSGNFKVLAYNLYPVLAAVNPEFGFNTTMNILDEELANEGNYFAIIKKINFEYDQYSLTPNQSVEFIFKFKFPENSDNVLLSDLDKGALLEILHKEAAAQMNVSNNTVLTEIAIMRRVATSLKGLPVSENLEALDYTFIPASYGGQITGSNNNANPSNGSEYATILIDGNINLSQLINEALSSSGAANLSFTTLNQGEYYATSLNVKLITSINDNVADAFTSATALVDDQVNIHIHFDEFQQGLYFKFGVTENTANQILGSATNALMLGAGYTEWLGEVTEPSVDPPITLQDDKDDDSEQREGSVTEEWNYAYKFMKGTPAGAFNSVFPAGPDRYAGAIACGLVDGLLSSVEMIWDLAKGTVTAGAGVIESTASYWWDIIETGCKQGILAAGTKLGNDVIGIGTAFYENATKAYEFIKKAYNQATPENMARVFNFAKDAVIEYFESITTLDNEGGYKVGKIAFEIIATFFTAGAAAGGTAAKFLTKIINQLQKWELDAIAKNLSTVLRAAEDIGSQAKKVFRCKILGKGCFVKDTPVLMANTFNNNTTRNPFRISNAKSLAVAAAMPIVAVPIQDVQLLDYAVAHETVNATYGMTASTDDDIYLGLMDKDPYTSDQQRERDEYQLDDENWNEVVFEEVNGNSTAKLALHNDWIDRKGYEVDAVVEMNLPEQGISGPFRITSIRHILPQKKPTDEDDNDDYGYKPVTALFTHESNQVYTISFDNGESLGVTYQHPIYSVTAGDWRLAGELKVGDQVLTKEGEATVANSAKKEGSETVYNLEVKELHNFLVTESGFVVHNSCWDEADKIRRNLGIKKKLGSPGYTKTIKKTPESDAIKDHAKYKDNIKKDGDGNIKICYDDLGFPDFNDFVPEIPGIGKLQWPIDMKGTSGDMTKARAKLNAALGSTFGKNSDIVIDGYPNVTWSFHHHQDGKTMQLVPKIINQGGADHLGGGKIAEKGGSNIFPGPDEIGNYKKNCK